MITKNAIICHAGAGQHIDDAIREAISLSASEQLLVYLIYNESTYRINSIEFISKVKETISHSNWELGK